MTFPSSQANRGLDALLARLNEHQLRVVQAGEGQFAVIGVPGSGKTTALVARVARLVRDGLAPNWILAMTFTVKAADELTLRLKGLGVEGGRFGTIHSVGLQILRDAEPWVADLELDIQERMLLEMKKLLQDWQRSRKIPRAGVDYAQVQAFVDACKHSRLCWVAGDPWGMNDRALGCLLDEGHGWTRRTGLAAKELVDCYLGLEELRAGKGLYSFDDMMLWSWMTLAFREGVRQSWRSNWSVVIVDEAQDSSSHQWDVARFLVGLPGQNVDARGYVDGDKLPHNLMVAGDPSQSIYAFRSAKPGIFVAYARNRAVTEIVLPVNYRSLPPICRAGTRLVLDRTWHLGGTIQPTRELGEQEALEAVVLQREVQRLLGEKDTSGEERRRLEKEAAGLADRAIVQERRFGDLLGEMTWILSDVQRRHAEGVPLSRMAVLSRLSVFLHLMETECARLQVPYELRASGSFWDNQDVRCLLGYLRVALGRDPDVKWEALTLNRPFRYIGKAVIGAATAQVKRVAGSRGATLCGLEMSETLLRMGSLNRRQEEAVQGYIQVIRMLRRHLEKGDGPGAMLAWLIQKLDYHEAMRKDGVRVSEDGNRAFVLRILVELSERFPSADALLDYVDGVQAGMQAARRRFRVKEARPDRDALVLSTIHRAKGLAWQRVYVADVTEESLPCAWADDLEEELRLFFVATTRAEDACIYTWSGEPDMRSRFLKKLLGRGASRRIREPREPAAEPASPAPAKAKPELVF